MPYVIQYLRQEEKGKIKDPLFLSDRQNYPQSIRSFWTRCKAGQQILMVQAMDKR